MSDTSPYVTGPNATAKGWNVTSQQEVLERDPSGNVVRGYRVFFQTGKGGSGSVFVPLAMYNPPNVRAAVAAMATQVDSVQGMSG